MRSSRQFILMGLVATVGASLLVALTAMVAFAAAQPAQRPDSPEAVLQFLNQTIDWYRGITTLDQTPVATQDVIFRDAVHRDAQQVLNQSFAYARAQAELLNQQGSAPGATTQPGRKQNLAQAASTAAVRVSTIQAQLDQLDSQIKSGAAATRPDLQLQRDKLESELNFAKSRQQVIDQFSAFVGDNTQANNLLDQINDLERSVPGAQADQKDSSGKPASAALQPAERPESNGVLGLIAEMFTLSRRIDDVKKISNATASLKQANDKLRAPLRTQLLDITHRGDALATTQPGDDAQKLQAQRAQLDDLSAQFKLLAGAGVPLGQQSFVLDSVHGTFQQWHESLSQEYRRTLRALFIRLGAIGGSILIVLIISNIWRRATFRYVSDVRRRRQFLLVRRLVVGLIVIAIIVAGVVSQFGSLVTFAGLITAGVAVALQTVILSSVAHFFTMGRYGVRVGDRVTISGITGDVVDVGILRLYLLELNDAHADLQPTGRIVVFANSVLFQSNAFFKQIPGSNFIWREIALTLSPDSDYHLAETKLMQAVRSVYAEYKENIHQQQLTVKRHIHVPLPDPEPQGRLRFVDAGLEFVVRYPVELRRAGEIDDRLTRVLLKTIEEEPKLRLVVSGTPKIQSANGRV